ncbi:MAG: hypothetical protein WC389_16935 [Lutibacter sp.]|jgi:hypothetical protein
MLTDFELQIAKIILKDDHIATSEARKILNVSDKMILTKANFPNIRHLLYSYMTAFHKGMYRGGMSWICVITTNDRNQLQNLVNQQG